MREAKKEGEREEIDRQVPGGILPYRKAHAIYMHTNFTSLRNVRVGVTVPYSNIMCAQ